MWTPSEGVCAADDALADPTEQSPVPPFFPNRAHTSSNDQQSLAWRIKDEARNRELELRALDLIDDTDRQHLSSMIDSLQTQPIGHAPRVGVL